MMEVSHGELRDLYMQCFETASQNQFELFQIMDGKGWYKVEPASTEQIGRVQELMQNNLHPDDQF